MTWGWPGMIVDREQNYGHQNNPGFYCISNDPGQG